MFDEQTKKNLFKRLISQEMTADKDNSEIDLSEKVIGIQLLLNIIYVETWITYYLIVR